MDFWEILWFCFVSFAFVAYLMVMFSIITDLFRDPDTSGILKAVWFLALIFLPFLTALVYVIVRGSGMTRRREQDLQTARHQQEAYIREVAGDVTPADQIARAKGMLDAGTITTEEYDRLKHKALN